ncbi:MAG TPA: hypothetical protein DCQ83_04155 [Fibrobacteres bacterium]|jgi:phosphatidate cytidylyltransferase|nr:hypothetical protein [Fibrobacterota bacterium]
MSNLTVRILSAIALILLGACTLLLNVHTRWAIIAFVVVGGAWELSRMIDRKFAAPHLAWFSALSTLAFSLPYFPFPILPLSLVGDWIWLVAIVSLLGYVLLAFRHLAIESLAPWLLMNGFVCAYMGLWATRAFALTGPELGWDGVGPLAFTVAVVAAEDTGAYAAGRLFGRHALAPRISAKKTVEGTVGGTVAGMLVAMLLGPVLVDLPPGPCLILGMVLALAAAMGDLFISVLKRYVGAKDTSNLIPGHGGIMDRFDALLFVAPIAWVGLRLLS